VAKVLARGAAGVGLGRAAILAVDEDPTSGLLNLIESIALELRFLASSLGRYDVRDLEPGDLWSPRPGWLGGNGPELSRKDAR
jgi:methylamine---glutamate N-methyltransferase subunit C